MMKLDYSEKVRLYKQLVDDVRNCGKLNDCNKIKSGIQLEKCNRCNEINLWSYWQGGVEHLNADILLAGQDWGSFDTEDGHIVFRNIDSGKPYLSESKSDTDKNLCKLFKEIGEVVDSGTDRNRNVFFTNFVLCYRKPEHRISGGFKQRWASNCSEYFVRLVEIIQPKVIICLGRSVYANVMKAAGLNAPRGSYNDIIELGGKFAQFGDHKCMIFPEAHCGVFGTNNRNRGKNATGIELQKNDWKKIKAYLNNSCKSDN